jgi:hypothetical protein
MSKKIKFYTWLAFFLIIQSSISSAQGTLEMVVGNFVGSPVLGPTTNPIGAVPMRRDNGPNNNQFDNPTAQQATSVTVSLANQTYSGLGYSNISTGLVFGASPTTAVSSTFPFIQQVDPNDTYNILGSFNLSPGGPTNNMFTSDPLSAPTVQSGTGIIADGFYSPPANDANGAVSVFTAAQVLFDQAGGPAVNNTATRYYYGNVVVTFSRFVANPVIHIAGLGGSYRYVPSGGNPSIPGDWTSTYFSTELEVQPGFSLTRMSGNSFFTVSGSNILNNAVTPNGASANTIGLFDDIGAASGSFRINGTVRTVTLKVYLRGSNSSQFPWSASAASVPGSNRAPFTGDIWWVSATAGIAQLTPLPATGLNLNAALNGNDVQLNWKTLSEANSNHFEIERSTDGINFSQIATKAAAGSSYTERNYSLVDANMTGSVYYYRVKLVDFDGQVTYSNVAIVRKSGGIKGVRMFPNPVVNQVNLEFSNAKGNYVVSVYNQAGQEVINQKTSITSTVQYVTINRNSLSDGSYIVRVRNAENSEVLFTEKMILQ